MKRNFKLVCIVLLCFATIFTIINIQIPNFSLYRKTTLCYNDNTKIGENEINIRLKILDIYRLDISCDYITHDLGAQIDKKYKNAKKCSASSLNPNVNSQLLDSLDRMPNGNSIETYRAVTKIKLNELNELKESNIQLGGFWSPKLKADSYCKENDIDFVAFIVPYMNRPDNLKTLVYNLHRYLHTVKYKFSYRIIVAEQLNTERLFNKGQIYNAAVDYAMSTYKSVDCLVLHDVDLVPLVNDSSIDYRCGLMPIHLTKNVLIAKQGWNRVYNQFLTGGALSLRPGHYIDANGFSNRFSGWGGEDDDWTLRMFNAKLCVSRPSFKTTGSAPFAMLKHSESVVNINRFKSLARTLDNQYIEGFNTIKEHAKVLNVTLNEFYTHLHINVDLN